MFSLSATDFDRISKFCTLNYFIEQYPEIEFFSVGLLITSIGVHGKTTSHSNFAYFFLNYGLIKPLRIVP